MSSSTGAVPSQLQLNWASSLDALLADLPDGWLKTQAQELRADADWPPEALPATIRCSGREFGAQWGEYELEAIGPHWAGRSATHLPERLTWPGCRFVRPLGSEQVVAVLQAWRQRSACPGAGVAVELRWRPLSGTRVSTEGLGSLRGAGRCRPSTTGCPRLCRATQAVATRTAAGEPCRLRPHHLARAGRRDYPPATAGPSLAHHRAALPPRRGDAARLGRGVSIPPALRRGLRRPP